MNVVLQTHGAKHIYKVPEGLRELCADISREVSKLFPRFNVAVKVVNNILLESQAILSILYRAGFTLEQIAVTAPRIQRAFREYLDAVDTQPTQIYEDSTCDERSMISIRDILEATGATRAEAERAATVIQVSVNSRFIQIYINESQAAFRGHYERMVSSEAEGKIQWQRAVTNTLDILRKAGATQAEISKAARLVKFAYRGYYTRRNQKIDAPEAKEEPPKKDERILEPVEAVQAVAWMEMMYNDSGLMLEKAHEAASIIQRAYKRYRAKKHSYDVQQLETTKTMVTEAVLDTVHRKIFEKVTSRDDIPKEYGTREEMMAASTKLQLAFKEQMRKTYLIKEERNLSCLVKTEAKKVAATEPQLKPKYRPVEPKVLPSETEEPLTEEEMDEITEPLMDEITSPELESEPEIDRPELVEEIEADEKVRETEEDEEREEEEDEKLEETEKKDEKLEEETGTEEEQEEE
ncbi:hypothetical protein E2986_01495 [Frieseomelitta varia]|uniref:Uncharacterized protein n=1 Tax=Frieseomelitta varia TaxID=561572 RepID=A0A833RVV4_9HYME|nr:hypothetical protein E2986_01495 [Frieseomelitta varia]